VTVASKPSREKGLVRLPLDRSNAEMITPSGKCPIGCRKERFTNQAVSPERKVGGRRCDTKSAPMRPFAPPPDDETPAAPYTLPRTACRRSTVSRSTRRNGRDPAVGRGDSRDDFGRGKATHPVRDQDGVQGWRPPREPGPSRVRLCVHRPRSRLLQAQAVGVLRVDGSGAFTITITQTTRLPVIVRRPADHSGGPGQPRSPARRGRVAGRTSAEHAVVAAVPAGTESCARWNTAAPEPTGEGGGSARRGGQEELARTVPLEGRVTSASRRGRSRAPVTG
jgi:hypothetical protein